MRGKFNRNNMRADYCVTMMLDGDTAQVMP
jgi:hypothetical protein